MIKTLITITTVTTKNRKTTDKDFYAYPIPNGNHTVYLLLNTFRDISKLSFNLRKGCIISDNGKLLHVDDIDYLEKSNAAALTTTEISVESYYKHIRFLKDTPELDFGSGCAA